MGPKTTSGRMHHWSSLSAKSRLEYIGPRRGQGEFNGRPIAYKRDIHPANAEFCLLLSHANDDRILLPGRECAVSLE